MTDTSYAEYEYLAINKPAYEYHASEITASCKSKISSQFHIPEIVLNTYLKTEGAKSGYIRTNKNGSWDVGPMQINSVHWKTFYERFKISPVALRNNGCVNLMVGAYLIREQLDEAGKERIDGWDAFFEVAANYHSKTPEFNQKYQHDWINNLKVLLE